MIVRSCPNIDEELLLSLLNNRNLQETAFQSANVFFFNSGSSSLRFFLSLLGSNKRIGLQVFTCPTVLEAVNMSGCIPVFMDINKDYFTTTLDIVSQHIHLIDVLILTHICGVPNPDYIEIKGLCKKNGIVLIDDLCQTFQAKVLNQLLEDLSENYFYSFFFDKPIAAASGGMLKVSADLYKKALLAYKRLPKENSDTGKKLLRKLYWMNKLLDPKLYSRDFRTDTIWDEFLLEYYPLSLNIKYLHGLLYSKIGVLFAKLRLKTSKHSIRRMSDIQRFYILRQLEQFTSTNHRLINYCLKHRIELPSYLTNDRIECSLSKRCLIKDNSQIEKECKEIALYNWPNLICRDKSEFPVAASVLENYINLPLWHNNI